MNFYRSEIWQKKLQTFTSVDATAKRRGVTIPEHLRVAPPTSETTIAADGDGAPKIDRAQAVQGFSDALKKLAAPQGTT